MSKPIINLIISAATTYGQIDLFEEEDITLTLNVADVKDITQRSAPFTQTFYIPGTANNNEILTSIFEIGADSTYDPRKKASAVLTVDNIPVTNNAIMQLTSIDITNNKQPYYSIVVYEDTKTFWDALDGQYLNDLTSLSGLTHPLDFYHVTNSWTANTPYYYGMVDYGKNWTMADMSATTSNSPGLYDLYPATQEKYYLDAIFDAAGFQYESSFLNSTAFTNNYILFNGENDFLLDSSFATARTFQAQITSGNTEFTGLTSSYTIMPYTPHYNNDSTNGNFDNGGLFSTTTFKYSADTPSIQKFHSRIEFYFTGFSYFYVAVTFHRSTLPNGVTNSTASPVLPGANYHDVFYQPMGGTNTGSAGQLITEQYVTQFANAGDPSIPQAVVIDVETPWLDGANSYPTGVNNYYPCEAGETFWMTYTFINNISSPSGSNFKLDIFSAETKFWNEVSTARVPGQSVPYLNYVPKQIKQTDFIDSLCKRYNLYIESSKINERTLIIEPRDVYYAAGEVKDWSQKLDISQTYSQQLLSEQQNKQIRFKYKEDKDYLNDNYQNIENRTYGDYLQIFDNDFTADEDSIEIIYSPTPLINVPGSTDFILPLIVKQDSNGNNGKTDFNIRVLQKNFIPLKPFESWNFNGVRFNSYPYLGHFDNPNSPTFDMNFGPLQYAYYPIPYIPNNNLVNKYWGSYLQEINDKNSYMLTAYFHLTPADINQLNYNDNIYIEGLTEGSGAYFKINTIQYNLTDTTSSKVELIKSLNAPQDNTTGSFIVRGNITNNFLQSRNSLVMGTNNTTNSNASILAGNRNSVGFNAQNSFVTGYANNVFAGSSNSSVIGGSNNIVYGQGSAVVGGYNNTIFGSGSTVLGGANYFLSGDNTTVATNLVVTSAITIGNIVFTVSGNSSLGLWTGGTGANSIQSTYGNNNASGTTSFASGYGNTAGGPLSFIAGGIYNVTNYNNSILGHASQSAFIGGGYKNFIEGDFSTIVGGKYNLINGKYSSVLGGTLNSATTNYSTVIGGKQNKASGNYSVILGGVQNLVTGQASSSIAGSINYNYGTNSFVGGKLSSVGAGKNESSSFGYNNSVNVNYSSVVNGVNNNIYGVFGRSFIGSGNNNKIFGNVSSILNGSANTVNNSYSTILGGILNTLNSNNSTIVAGAYITATTIDETAYVPNLAIQSNHLIYWGSGSTNPTAGVVTLIAGTATVTTNKVGANSVISYFGQNSSGSAGELTISARVPGVSFTITSTSLIDTRLVFWTIGELF